MNKAKRNYKSKCKSRNIDFYLHEQDLYNFSKEINFNKFVKDMLRVAKQMGKDAIIKWLRANVLKCQAVKLRLTL